MQPILGCHFNGLYFIHLYDKLGISANCLIYLKFDYFFWYISVGDKLQNMETFSSDEMGCVMNKERMMFNLIMLYILAFSI